MTRYNPISYHNGSVWPHDNALCAAGLVRYGLLDEAHRVMEGIVRRRRVLRQPPPRAVRRVPAAGFGFPVGYPTSCSPQAWAAASPLLFLRSLLRFEPDIRKERLHLAPAIPEWLGRFRLDGVPIMGGRLSLEVDGDRVESISVPDHLQIVPTPLYDSPVRADQPATVGFSLLRSENPTVAEVVVQASIRRPWR